MNRREHHAATRPLKQIRQMLAALRLHGRLAEVVVAALELAEELVVKVVAVGQHHERRVLHRGLADHAGGEEEYGEALAALLRVPDHARATQSSQNSPLPLLTTNHNPARLLPNNIEIVVAPNEFREAPKPEASNQRHLVVKSLR